MKAAALLLALAVTTARAQIPKEEKSLFDFGPPVLGSVRAVNALFLGAAAPPSAVEISTMTEAAMVEDARKLFVELRFRLAPYDASSGVDQGRFWKRRHAWGFESKARDRTFLTVAGARGERPGSFAVPLFDYDIERLEELTVVDSEGGEHEAKPVGLSRHGEDVWFEAAGLAARPMPPLVPGEPKGPARHARLAMEEDGSRVDLSAWHPKMEVAGRSGVFRKKSKDGAKRELIDREIGLVFDSSGAWRGWLGKAFGSQQMLSPQALRQDTLSWTESLRLRREAESLARRAFPVLRLHFQVEGRSFSRSAWGDEKVPKERTDVGFPLTPTLIFSARSLSSQEVKGLTSVEVLVDGKPRPAKFIGVLTKGVVGYLVAPERPVAPIEPGKAPEDGELVMAIEPFAATAALQAWAYLDRLEGTEAGYAGERRRKPRYLGAAGGVLAGLDGRPVGLIVEQARHEAVAEKDRWKKPAPLLRLHTFEELAKAFADPEQAVDPRFKPDAVDKRRPWLGAETQDINADLAKLLDISGATKGGAVGQLVLEVIPLSPAARAGLKGGDVLLRLQEAGKRQTLAIPASVRSDSSEDDFALTETGRYFRKPRTGLDDALADFGAGTQLTVTYIRDGAERSVSVALEAAPLGIESAPKLADKATGLTVKEITGDARRLLRLEKGFKGLLIYDVESGSPAAVAGLRPFGLLLAVGGRSVSTIKELESLLAAKRADKSPSINVRTVYMGQPLYSDLRVAP